MDKVNYHQPVVILSAVIAGLLLGHVDVVARHSSSLIVPLLMLMLFGLFLNIRPGKFTDSFRNIRFSAANMLINFVWTPAFAYLLGYVFLSDEWPLWVGFVMLMVTPCTDWYLVFTGIARGNVPLSAAALPVNLILQVLLLPVYLLLFFGKSGGGVALGSLTESIVLVLFVPFLLAFLIRKTIGTDTKTGANMEWFFEKSQVWFLALAVVAMFASEGKNLTDHPTLICKLLFPLLLFFAVTFFLSRLIGKILKFNYADKVSLVMTSMARNSPIALAIAVSAFPAEPLVALSLVIGPMIELPVLILTSQLLLGTLRNSRSKHTR